MTTDIIYYISDLSAENRRKILLKDESKEGIIGVVSEVFKKPLLNIYLKEKEENLLEEKINKFKFKKYKTTDKHKMGDFLLQMEEAGEL